ncbi:unnamed protein product [Closterium sp. Yama58-4]|nr:unnamed protein product [Closterium sp. Yama58-4]
MRAPRHRDGAAPLAHRSPGVSALAPMARRAARRRHIPPTPSRPPPQPIYAFPPQADEYIQRALVEEDVGGQEGSAEGGTGRVGEAAGEEGRRLYSRGDFAAAKAKSLDAYLTTKVGMFPDVLERLALRHLEHGDQISELDSLCRCFSSAHVCALVTAGVSAGGGGVLCAQALPGLRTSLHVQRTAAAQVIHHSAGSGCQGGYYMGRGSRPDSFFWERLLGSMYESLGKAMLPTHAVTAEAPSPLLPTSPCPSVSLGPSMCLHPSIAPPFVPVLRVGRPTEARDAARIALKSPWWTLGASYQEVAELAGYGDSQLEYALERLTEEGRKEDVNKGKAEAQVALDHAAFLLDVAAAEGTWDETREQLAGLYREAGLEEMASFVLAGPQTET